MRAEPGRGTSGEFPPEVRAQLRSRRADCYLSYIEAAHLSGVSASTIKAMEGPRGHLTGKTLAALCHGYALTTTPDASRLREVLAADSVRSIAKALGPQLESGSPEGSRALLDYYAVVDAIATETDPPDAAVDGLIRLVQGALPPVEVIAVTGDLADRLGSAIGNQAPSPARFSGAAPVIGPTPMQIGAILNSGLSEDTKQRLFKYASDRNAEAVAGVETELESLIKLLRAEIEQRLR